MNYRLLIITLSMATASAPLYCMKDPFAPTEQQRLAKEKHLLTPVSPQSSTHNNPFEPGYDAQQKLSPQGQSLPLPLTTFTNPFSETHEQQGDTLSSDKSRMPAQGQGSRVWNWIQSLWSNSQPESKEDGEDDPFLKLKYKQSEIAQSGNRFVNWARQWWGGDITVKTEKKGIIYHKDIYRNIKRLSKLYQMINTVRWHRAKVVAPLAGVITAGMMYIFGAQPRNTLLYGAGTGVALGALTYFGSLFKVNRQAAHYEQYLNGKMKKFPYSDLKGYLPNYSKDSAYLQRAANAIYALKAAEKQSDQDHCEESSDDE